MNVRWRLLWLPWLGCTSDSHDSATFEPDPGLDITVTDFQTRACWPDAQGTDSLMTNQVGVGAIRSFMSWPCRTARNCPQTPADGSVLHVAYDHLQTGDCVEECWFRVEYMLTGVPAGEWLVQVEDEWFSEVSVP